MRRLAVVALLLLAGCGGHGGAPSSVVPADATVYVGVSAAEVERIMALDDVSVERDVQPWLGERAAYFARTDEGGLVLADGSLTARVWKDLVEVKGVAGTPSAAPSLADLPADVRVAVAAADVAAGTRSYSAATRSWRRAAAPANWTSRRCCAMPAREPWPFRARDCRSALRSTPT